MIELIIGTPLNTKLCSSLLALKVAERLVQLPLD